MTNKNKPTDPFDGDILDLHKVGEMVLENLTYHHDRFIDAFRNYEKALEEVSNDRSRFFVKSWLESGKALADATREYASEGGMVFTMVATVLRGEQRMLGMIEKEIRESE